MSAPRRNLPRNVLKKVLGEKYIITIKVLDTHDFNHFEVAVEKTRRKLSDNACIPLSCTSCTGNVLLEFKLVKPPPPPPTPTKPIQEFMVAKIEPPNDEPEIDGEMPMVMEVVEMIKTEEDVKLFEIKSDDSDEDDVKDDWSFEPTPSKPEVHPDDRIHSAKRKKLCPYCGRLFLVCNYDRHLELHNPTIRGSYQCDYCKKFYSSKDSLRSHLMLQHMGKEPKRKTAKGEPEGVFSCSFCGKSYTMIRRLKIHIGRCHNENRRRDFVCEICSCAFYSRGTLKTHMWTHTPKLNYFCEICGKGFQRVGNLQVHMVVHNPVPTYSCSFCPKMFARKKGKIVHERIHTGERNYACNYPNCSSRFYDEGTLRQHKLGHIRKDKNLGMMPLPQVAKLYYKRNRYPWEPEEADAETDSK